MSPTDLALGAIPHAKGVRFTVWSPSTHAVMLQIEGERKGRPMHAEVGGSHQLDVRDVRAGARYRFSLDGGDSLADPASRSQPEGVHGPSEIVDLAAFDWHDEGFCGRDLADHVISEVHIGTLTPDGTFDAAISALDDLVDVGISAVEIMPVAQFPGERNWGYDGVFPFAVQHSYGGPAGLQRLVDACHRRGLSVILDVVYNHVGPEGNILEAFGPYFTDRYRTPWGKAVNLDGPGSDDVRRYLLQNAAMWFLDFHLDGLRLDAVHELVDRSAIPFLVDLSTLVADLDPPTGTRPFLTAESADNDPGLTTRRVAGGLGMDAQWSDDYHHAVHAAVTGERSGYYVDYGTIEQVATAMEADFVLQGQHSTFRNRRHGAPVGFLPSDRFVHFVQNHDHIGNRPGGERMSTLVEFDRLRVALAVLFLSPGIPLLFMGDEYGETAPFPYFVDHGDPELLTAVQQGRNREFAEIGLSASRFDPASSEAFDVARPDPSLRQKGDHRHLLALTTRLIALRRATPALHTTSRSAASATADGPVVTLVRRHPKNSVVAFFNLCDDGQTVAVPTLGRPQAWSHLVGSGDPEFGRALPCGPDEATCDEPFPLAPWSFCAYQREEGVAS
jgi:maltooligosyltrehalose trehalohydrolase